MVVQSAVRSNSSHYTPHQTAHHRDWTPGDSYQLAGLARHSCHLQGPSCLMMALCRPLHRERVHWKEKVRGGWLDAFLVILLSDSLRTNPPQQRHPICYKHAARIVVVLHELHCPVPYQVAASPSKNHLHWIVCHLPVQNSGASQALQQPSRSNWFVLQSPAPPKPLNPHPQSSFHSLCPQCMCGSLKQLQQRPHVPSQP